MVTEIDVKNNYAKKCERKVYQLESVPLSLFDPGLLPFLYRHPQAPAASANCPQS